MAAFAKDGDFLLKRADVVPWGAQGIMGGHTGVAQTLTLCANWAQSVSLLAWQVPALSLSWGRPLWGSRKCQLSAPASSRARTRLPGAEAPPGPTPGSSLTIFTAASSDVTVSRACGAQGKKRGEEGAGPGFLRRDAQMHPPTALPPVLPPRTAHLVNVAIGPGPHTLQQLKAVSRILQRHIPQQRHGPAPDRPAGASCGAGAERRGAGRESREGRQGQHRGSEAGGEGLG